MPRVKLSGLNIRKNKTGKWYVSYRKTGTALISGFEGSREELVRHMASTDFLNAYTVAQQAKGKRVYPDGTFGALIDWYETRDAWTKLAPRTQADYLKARDFLEPTFPISYLEITGDDVLEMRDRAAETRYLKFSNDVVAYMSSVFREAKDARKLERNPAHGIKRLYKADKEANRAWKPHEWEAAWRIAPNHIKPALAIARWAGLRGQDIAVLQWANYREDKDLGRALVFTPLKNGEKVGEIELGVVADLRAVLDPLAKGVLPSAPICRNSLGKQYPSENALRKVWQDFKASEAFTRALPASSDLTLHGLRVTYASELRENGFSDREIADMLGDLTESMGKRYARGARMRKTSVRVFQKMTKTA